MSTSIKFQSFSDNNIGERSELNADVAAGTSQLSVLSTEGFGQGDTVYVGHLSREGCERVVVDQVVDARTLSITFPTALPHRRLDAVTAVLGDKIKIYRAPNVDDTPPSTASFVLLAMRGIDPDQPESFYTDSDGSSAFWYRGTYFNALTDDETPLEDASSTRGSDFGHYASLAAIRGEAGFTNAFNLADWKVDAQRRAAQSVINSELGNYFTVPFKKPISETIETITIKLAAGYLLQNAYSGSKQGDALVKEAKAMLESVRNGSSTIDDGSGANATPEGVSFYPDESATPRAFTMGDQF